MVSLPPCEAKAPRNSREVRRNFCGRKRGFPKIQPLYPGDFRRKHSEKIHFYQRFTEKSVHLCCRSPPRGAWIEISKSQVETTYEVVAPPHGERGLKCYFLCGEYGPRTVAPPHGERGLKFCFIPVAVPTFRRSPPRGAWIEMTYATLWASGRSPPRGAWIEITAPLSIFFSVPGRSPPRGAWIEI